MEDDLRILVTTCSEAGNRNVLTALLDDSFCTKHGVSRDHFYYLFAKHVAEEFVNGELSYSDGDVAMNNLAGLSEFKIDGFPWEIFSAFDSGEFYRSEDPEGTIPWQKYTLPLVMEALAKEVRPPRT